LAPNEKQICPQVGTKVLFSAATACARKIDVKNKLVALTSSHRGYVATIDNGWIIIDQEWYAK